MTGRVQALGGVGWSDRWIALRVRRAIATDQLVLHCQPTVDCQTGEVVAAETLVRWRHPTRGLIPPGAWVPAIESSRVAADFNLHVLGLAVRQHEEWVEAGVHVPLSVNVTPACLANDRFVAALVELFGGGPEDGAIHLEITERTTEINTDSLRSNVEDLADLGFRILLDDFGAGYSSLVRLANLPVATLKIDGSLVADITWREAHALIVNTVIRLTHDLGQTVVGEGVEDDATWRMLRDLGCDVIQGFGVARPMPAEDFPAFLDSYLPAPPDRANRRDGVDRRRTDRRRLAQI